MQRSHCVYFPTTFFCEEEEEEEGDLRPRKNKTILFIFYFKFYADCRLSKLHRSLVAVRIVVVLQSILQQILALSLANISLGTATFFRFYSCK